MPRSLSVVSPRPNDGVTLGSIEGLGPGTGRSHEDGRTFDGPLPGVVRDEPSDLPQPGWRTQPSAQFGRQRGLEGATRGDHRLARPSVRHEDGARHRGQQEQDRSNRERHRVAVDQAGGD